jgi:hypothetical protein
MTHIILDCKKTFCVHYWGQCEFERMARIDKNEVYCEEYLSCYNADANADINIKVK